MMPAMEAEKKRQDERMVEVALKLKEEQKQKEQKEQKEQKGGTESPRRKMEDGYDSQKALEPTSPLNPTHHVPHPRRDAVPATDAKKKSDEDKLTEIKNLILAHGSVVGLNREGRKGEHRVTKPGLPLEEQLASIQKQEKDHKAREEGYKTKEDRDILKQMNEDKLTTLEKLIIAQKEEQLHREAAADAAQEAKKAGANAVVTKFEEEWKAATLLLEAAQKAREEAEKNAAAEAESRQLWPEAASKVLEQQAISEDQQDAASTTSATSNSLDSVFSVEPSETSATAFSRDSGFSVEQIQSATRVFVSILQEDEMLMPLYELARNNTRIGPKRLRRHIRETVKAYAENLKEEANDHLEFAASRLVQAKARYAARYIASGEDGYQQPHDFVNHRNRSTKDPEDSSEEETAEPPVDETEFRDLKAFRLFLTGSDAYATLQVQIHAFCTKSSTMPQNKPAIGGLKAIPYTTSPSQLPEPIQYAYEEILSTENYRKDKGLKLIPATKSNTKRTWRVWQEDAQNLAGSLLLGFDWTFIGKAALFLLIDVVFLLTDDTFIVTGCLEPPLEVGWTRIRSECSCGDQFFDDFKEQRIGGVATLVQEMKQSSVDAKITVVPYRTGTAVQKYTARVSMWLCHISSSLLAAFPWHNRTPTGLPHHNVGGTATTTSTTHAGNPQQHRNPVYLMSCVHRSHDDPVLLQVNVHVITNDQALFQLLRTQITQRRNRLLRALSCRSIQGIFFSKFCLRSGGSVEVRNHNESCLSMASIASYCDCLPPVHIVEPFPNAEYRCDIPCPPGTWPPIGSNILLHMLKCPKTISEKYTWVLCRVPKRVTGELSGDGDQPADGWGFYFEEGWDVGSIIAITLIIMLTSLLFGICWSVLRSDIQGAFGVSAYMGTVCGLVITFLVVQAGKAD